MNIGNINHFDSPNKEPLSGLPYNASLLAGESPQDNWRDCFPEIIGRSPAMQKMLHIIYKIARSDSSVLICGDSGTGKELIAAALHRLSNRSSRRFVTINCSAIPENLLESELFGHEKGAFTSADRRRIGHFEAAAGGSIFLDEIGDMAPSLQAKLLRVLQEKQFSPIGSNKVFNADVRVITATNVDLHKAVLAGQFRLDLYYRLNVLPIIAPPLRERQGDLPELINHFLDLSNAKHGEQRPCFFADDVIQCLQCYAWPGNVRELENLVERLVVMSGGGKITVDLLPTEYVASIYEPYTIEHVSGATKVDIAPQMEAASRATAYIQAAQVSNIAKLGVLPPEGINLIETIEHLENSYIMQALQRTNHNKNQAAKLLGLNRTTLVERIKKRKLAPLNAPSQEL